MKTHHVLTILFVCGLSMVTGCTQSAKCKSSIPNASYTGKYKGVDNNLSAADMALDLHCAEQFKNNPKYKNGFVTIYGSSRLGEDGNIKDVKNPKVAEANVAVYNDIKKFAEEWTRKYGSTYPIMTGAGPGLMEAGSRGAKAAGGPSIGYTTYYDLPPKGNADEAFWKYKSTDTLIDDGLIFSSVAIREYTMILHSAAIIIAPGGTGTEWEIFQILETTKSDQLATVPIFLIGNKETHWKGFYIRLEDMITRGTIRRDEVTKHFTHVNTATEIIPALKTLLKIP